MPKAKTGSDGKYNKFHIEFKTPEQKEAYLKFQENDILFLAGAAGSGKSHIAMAFALNEIYKGTKKRIILTRPIVESGRSMGFLPGDLNEKVDPYMAPLNHCLDKILGHNEVAKKEMLKSVEVSPISFLRGKTFEDAICIFDEAQNSTLSEFKLYLTRLGENSKIIVTGDPSQSDIGDASGLSHVMEKLEGVKGIDFVHFNDECIVRHPIIKEIIRRL